ncbi:MAG: YcbK family protein [Polyangia bacterium]
MTRFFLLCAAVTMVTCAPAFVDARGHRTRPNPNPTIELFEINTHEIFRLEPDRRGRFGQKQLRGWNHFLRCHYTGRVHHMSSRLAELIYATARHFGDKKVMVVDGYRAPRVARKKGNPKSPHKKGLACDFRIDGVPNTTLRDYLRESFKRVGVGYYPNSDFVHLDVGRKVSGFWIDYSGPGQRAVYSKHPEEDLKEETAGGQEPQGDGGAGAIAPNATALVPSTDENH